MTPGTSSRALWRWVSIFTAHAIFAPAKIGCWAAAAFGFIVRFARPKAERYQQYEVLRREDGSLWELGRGAMGITYKAYDTNLRFPVALKVINSAYLESDTARQRFLREARAAAALRHPNVAQVFNIGTEEDKYFYVMEFIDGETLEARVKRSGPLEPAEALNIALQVSRALAVAAK